MQETSLYTTILETCKAKKTLRNYEVCLNLDEYAIIVSSAFKNFCKNIKINHNLYVTERNNDFNERMVIGIL